MQRRQTGLTFRRRATQLLIRRRMRTEPATPDETTCDIGDLPPQSTVRWLQTGEQRQTPRWHFASAWHPSVAGGSRTLAQILEWPARREQNITQSRDSQ